MTRGMQQLLDHKPVTVEGSINLLFRIDEYQFLLLEPNLTQRLWSQRQTDAAMFLRFNATTAVFVTQD